VGGRRLVIQRVREVEGVILAHDVSVSWLPLEAIEQLAEPIVIPHLGVLALVPKAIPQMATRLPSRPRRRTRGTEAGGRDDSRVRGSRVGRFPNPPMRSIPMYGNTGGGTAQRGEARRKEGRVSEVERTTTTTTEVATHVRAEAGAEASASRRQPPPPPPPAPGALRTPRAQGMQGLMLLSRLLLVTRQRHHNTSATGGRVSSSSSTPASRTINASRTRVRYRDSAHAHRRPRANMQAESPSKLVLPTPSLRLLMTTSIAAA
jgi:hypothetical protein